MIAIEVNKLNFPLTCCPNNSPTIQCNSVTITVGSTTRKICDSSSPLYIYNEKAPYMEVTFLSTNFTKGHEFNITYKGKWLDIQTYCKSKNGTTDKLDICHLLLFIDAYHCCGLTNKYAILKINKIFLPTKMLMQLLLQKKYCN